MFIVAVIRDGTMCAVFGKAKSAEVARAQAADVLKEINKPRILSKALLDGKPTAHQAAELYRAQVETDFEIKPRTRDYRLETITLRHIFEIGSSHPF